jgi:endonuclease IV
MMELKDRENSAMIALKDLQNDPRFLRGLKEMVPPECLQFMGSRLDVVMHLDDSLGKAGSLRDRHWHFGKGELGHGALGMIVNHPAVRRLPLIMETPGTVEDDRCNMKVLKKLWDCK